MEVWASVITLIAVVVTVATLLAAVVAAARTESATRRVRLLIKASLGEPDPAIARAVDPIKPTLEIKLDRLTRLIGNAQGLTAEITTEIEARAARAAQLKSDAETAEALAALKESERQAVARLVRAEISTGVSNEAERLLVELQKLEQRNRRSNWIFFLAGALMGVAIQLLVRPLF